MHSMNRHPPSTLKFRQLEYFVAEAEESKLTHAASRLPASPTAVQQANLTLSTRPNELSGTRQHRPQKTQGGTRRDRCIVSLILLAANLQVIIRSARLREIDRHREGAGVDQCHACTATATQYGFQ
jgi:hypothetical protein